MRHKQQLTSFWNNSASTLFQILTTSTHGLTGKEAQKRLRKYGLNHISSHGHLKAFRMLLQNFKNPLVILLLISTTLVGVMGNFKSAMLISLIVIGSIIIDFIQEYRSTHAMTTLQKVIAPTTWVMRDGEKIKIPIEHIVPGDIVELSAGDIIPGDGLVLNAKDLFINQSVLNGESMPIEKQYSESPSSVRSPLECSHVLLFGTSVISGWAKMLICQTGLQTMLGENLASLEQARPASAFTAGTKELGGLLIRITVCLVILTLLVNLFLKRSWLDTILFSIALGVGLTPQFLNAIISITFARFAVLLSKKKVIVKRLSAIYDLGIMDVLCTDKTGTLTEAVIKLESAADWRDNPSDRTFFLSYINSTLETGYQSPLDAAILSHASLDVGTWQKIDEIPFSAGHRRISVLACNREERLLIVKGPLEDILGKSAFLEGADEKSPLPFDAGKKEDLQNRFKQFSKKGLKLLGVAYKPFSMRDEHIQDSDENNLIFAGYVSFFDQPKTSAAEVVRLLSTHGTTLKIITGDNEYVTQYICEKLSIPIHGVLLGPDIEALSPSHLKERVEQVNVYCRVTPLQKKKIVEALQSNGHVVGFLGDGINDLGAFSVANVSISVNNAVSAAKEAAHFVLLGHHLDILHQGILEARKAYNNILKYMMTGISSNFGNMISMAGASLFLPFLPMLPVQILLNNFLYDLSEIGITYDNVDEENCTNPPRWDIKFMRNFMVIFGPLSSIFDFFVFYILLKVLHVTESLFQTGWFVESLITQILAIFLVRTKRAFYKSKPHPFLLWTAALAIIAGILLLYTRWRETFGFVELPPSLMGIFILITVGYISIIEGAKKLYYRS